MLGFSEGQQYSQLPFNPQETLVFLYHLNKYYNWIHNSMLPDSLLVKSITGQGKEKSD